VIGGAALGDYLDRRVGPEPLDPGFTPEVLARAARGRRAPVKAFLLDQRRVAGVGNIYADEALFRAGIHPLRPAGRLRRAEIERLHAGILAALERGIERQGASIDDYRDSNGERGSMQDEFLIHLRAGQPCIRCGRPVTKTTAAGRGTYLCSRCQPAPRPRRRRTPAA
jgi:formamidopyrimidine-DNA glycosylase